MIHVMYRVNIIPVKISSVSFVEIDRLILKFIALAGVVLVD